MSLLARGLPLAAGLAMLLIGSGMASANDVYIAQSASGAANGTSCANAFAYGYFNTSGNWTGGPPTGTVIGPGTTVHICGTITGAVNSTGLIFQRSGTSGSPVTLLFEPNAVMTSPAWNFGISLGGQSYVTVNGGTNGVIQNTANGTELANSLNSTGIGDGSCGSNVTIQNLSVLNIYIRTSNSSDADGGGSGGIALSNCGSNITISGNTSTQAHANIWLMPMGTPSNWNVYNNTTVGATWGIAIAVGRYTDQLSSLYVYNNDVSDGLPWEDPADNYHKDGIFIFGQGSGGGGGSVQYAYIYNNYVHGDWGSHASGYVYINQNTNYIYLFNNTLSAPSSQATNGLLYIGYTGDHYYIVNNDILGDTDGNGFAESGGATNVTFENNILQSFQAAIYTLNTTYSALDYNDYWTISGSGVPHPWQNYVAYGDTFAQWQSQLQDVHGQYGNPSLSNFLPPSGSLAIAAGANLTSMCNGQSNPGLGALCYDASGTMRPYTGLWDVGAYQHITPILAPPSNLRVVTE
jgi:hypothetical protein